MLNINVFQLWASNYEMILQMKKSLFGMKMKFEFMMCYNVNQFICNDSNLFKISESICSFYVLS